MAKHFNALSPMSANKKIESSKEDKLTAAAADAHKTLNISIIRPGNS